MTSLEAKSTTVLKPPISSLVPTFLFLYANKRSQFYSSIFFVAIKLQSLRPHKHPRVNISDNFKQINYQHFHYITQIVSSRRSNPKYDLTIESITLELGRIFDHYRRKDHQNINENDKKNF